MSVFRLLLTITLLLLMSSTLEAEAADKVARIGFIGRGSASTAPIGVTQFWERLRELGYVEGKNLHVETRWAGDRVDRLPRLVAELLQERVELIVTYGTTAAMAAKNATRTVPIVAPVLADPVGAKLVESLAHPGGNVIGLSMGFSEGLSGKWIELLQGTVPTASTIAVVTNPDNQVLRDLAEEAKAVASKRGLKVHVVQIREASALEDALDKARKSSQALLVFGDAAVLAHRGAIIAMAAKYRLPAMYNLRDFVDAGGPMGYAPDTVAQFRRAADYVDKILQGANAGDLPIEQPTKFELILNIKTAKALRIKIPESILLRADEVIR